MLTGAPSPVRSVVPAVEPVVQDPEGVVANASLLLTVILCVCAPAAADE